MPVFKKSPQSSVLRQYERGLRRDFVLWWFVILSPTHNLNMAIWAPLFFCLRKELKWEVQIWHAAVIKLWGTVYCIIMAARRCSWGYTGLDFCGMSKAHFAVLIWPLVDGSVSQTLKLRTSNVIKTEVLSSTPRPEPSPRPPRPRTLSIQQGRNTSAA